MATIKDLITLAKNEKGYLEKKTNEYLDYKTKNAGYNNYTKYARDLDNIKDFYNGKKNGYSWCSVFVAWCFVKTFGTKRAKELLNYPPKSLGAGVGYAKKYFVNKNQYFNSPQIGDCIFFKNDKGGMQHIGLVYNFDSTYVYTIEGNTNSTAEVVANGGSVCTKKYKLNYKHIDGYGRPLWSKEEKDQTEFVIKYVYNVDDEGLVVHEQPAGKDTGELLKAGTQVEVYETQGSWSRIGDNKWVYSSYLSKTKPKTKTVTNVKNQPLNVRNKPSTKGKVVGGLYNGNVVQVYKTKNGWSKLSKDEERWCASSYLK